MLQKVACWVVILCLVLTSLSFNSAANAKAEQNDELTNSKERSTIYTEEKVAAARENVNKYSWAKSLRDKAVEDADSYLVNGIDYLWHAVPPQTIPRSSYVNQKLGSPITGKEMIEEYGLRPWLADPMNEPWKIIDPSSGYKFPTNDFEAYYRSGLDEHGIFQPELADRELLVNTLYPEKGPDWGVDDGSGWVDDNGDRWTFVAHYAHFYLWYSNAGKALFENALPAFRDAYIYTGDIKYARAGTILLDRIADVYPDMDMSEYNKNDYHTSSGGTGLGKTIGSIWETFIVKDYMSAYDAFFPIMNDPEIVDFLSEKAEHYQLDNPKHSGAAIRRNIEDGIVREVYPGVKTSRIRGNNGMHQSALAMASVVLDTLPETKEWLDFNFQAGGLSNGLEVEFDVTSQLQADLETDNQFSIKIYEPNSGAGGTAYVSRKASNANHHPQLVITLSGGGEFILDPEADAYVRGGDYASQNFGTSDSLVIRNAPDPTATREAYIRFNLSDIDGKIEEAKIKLRHKTLPARQLTHKAEWIEDDAWEEDEITWNNKPESTGIELAEWQLETMKYQVTGGNILPF